MGKNKVNTERLAKRCKIPKIILAYIWYICTKNEFTIRCIKLMKLNKITTLWLNSNDRLYYFAVNYPL